MTARNVLSLNHSDSGILTTVDLVSGHATAVEIPHFEALNDIYPGPTQDSIWAEFDGDGGRVAKYIGDGQLASEANDYSPTGIYDTPSYPSSSSNLQWAVNTPIYVGRNTTLHPTNNDFYSSGYEIKNSVGTVILSSNYTYSLDASIDIIASAAILTDNINGNDYGISLNNNLVFDYNSYEGTSLSGLILTNGKIYGIGRIEVGGAVGYHSYLVELEYNSGNNTLVAIAKHHLQTETSWNGKLVSQNSQHYCLETDNIVVLGTDWGYPAEINLDTFTLTISEGGSFYGYRGAEDFLLTARKLAHLTVLKSLGDYDTLKSESSYNECRTLGFPITIIDRDFNTSISRTRAISELPEIISTNWQIVHDDEMVDGIQGRCWILYAYRDSNNVLNLLDKLVVVNADTNEVYVSDVSNLRNSTDNKLAEMTVYRAVIYQKQAYKVEGTVKQNGVGIVTDVILVDNTSKKVIGRAKSAAGTGAYYFRCWTPGKKSVFAIHPTTGGLRLAAEITPVAVG